MQQHYLISKCVLFQANNFLLVALSFRNSTSEGIERKMHTNIP